MLVKKMVSLALKAVSMAHGACILRFTLLSSSCSLGKWLAVG